MTDLSSREKIIEAAVKEFSAGGFPGSRVENIAKAASVNKAMIFYYFGSKEGLYKVVIKNIVGQLMNIIKKTGGIDTPIDPEKFIESFPENYVRFFSGNRDFLRIIGVDLILSPSNLKEALSEFFNSEILLVPQNLRKVIPEWYKQGLITESNPVHLFLNVISLCIFPLIVRVFPEIIFNIDLDNDKFIEDRIKSIKNLLKRGLLK
ncbi:MAG: TetR/AcrR family transcriptional regulator [Candidatus Aminicenantes bacterium]|nr:TetR/AcrR family transcriptional regulator [Candidatus Aminicenantes bacterium]